jgi:plastocyanin
MNKTIAILLGIIVIVAAGVFIMRDNRKTDDTAGISPTPVASAAVSPVVSPTPLISAGVSVSVGASVKTFTVSGKPFSFDPSEIRVKKGDTVKIVFKNTEGIHDWVIDEFNVRTPKIQAGQTATIEFIATKTGTFEYYCSVGSHRAQGMKGKLIVE